MRTVTMIGCDNEPCKATEFPEVYYTTAGKPRNRPPYGWLTAMVDFQGCGPAFKVTVCSVECLEEAVRQRLREEEGR